eukprot:m.336776 g.336776  ORF g.336776 m.336776 type:complete len:225 (+) comp17958_c0_seq1:262-936(+)
MSKVAVVVGYGKGIGHSVAMKWATEGFRVALVSRTASKLEEATKVVPNSSAFPADVTDVKSLTTCLESIEKNLGPVDHLIYNAGSGVWKPYNEITHDELDLAFKINTHGLLACAQYLFPKMEERGGGFLSVTGATASLRGMPFTSGFAAAKASQRALCQSMARQLWKKKIHVCYNIIDAVVGVGENKMNPDSIANEYFHLSQQTPDCWTFENHIQTHTSDMSLL